MTQYNVLKSTSSLICTTFGALENLSHGLNGVSLAARYEGECFARLAKLNTVAKEKRRKHEIETEMAAIEQMIRDTPVPKPKQVKKAGTG